MNYPNLLQNGKLFPYWVIKNFKSYKIPKEENVDEGLDNCNIKQEKKNLRNYQLFISKFLNYNSPFNSILVKLKSSIVSPAGVLSSIRTFFLAERPLWNINNVVSISG